MFKVLFLCTGNRCRSPVAEGFMRQLAGSLPLEVSSAGLLDLGAAPALPEVLKAGRTVGLDMSGHRARPLSVVDLDGIDLVIGLERSHVAAAVVEKGASFAKVFTFAEIVRLLERVPPPDGEHPEARARSAVRRAHEARQSQEFVPGEDIQDPFGGPEKGYINMAMQVRELSDRLLVGLFGSSVAQLEPARRAD
jgi:protein-tyrosine phosphatase